jgi:hypothetical protein
LPVQPPDQGDPENQSAETFDFSPIELQDGLTVLQKMQRPTGARRSHF